jgi:hypothetical protein
MPRSVINRLITPSPPQFEKLLGHNELMLFLEGANISA